MLHRFVTCTCLTRNRRQWLPGSIRCYQAQTHPNRELLIVASGDDVSDLVPKDDPTIRYVHLGGQGTIGVIRNVAAQLARGEVIAHWDDDDYYHPERLSEQVHVLAGGAMATGYRSCYFQDSVRGKCYRYQGPQSVGSSLCYRVALWKNNPFQNLQIGEDVNWVRRVRPYIVDTEGTTRMIATTHAGGTSPRVVTNRKQWIECDESELGQV